MTTTGFAGGYVFIRAETGEEYGGFPWLRSATRPYRHPERDVEGAVPYEGAGEMVRYDRRGVLQSAADLQSQ